MPSIDILELFDRVDHTYDLSGLSEVERRVFLLLDFRTIYEMEGFTHFFASYWNPHVKTIHNFLLEIGDRRSAGILKRMIDLVDRHVPTWDPDDVDGFFCGLSDAEYEKIDGWGKEYYDLMSQRWEAVNQWLESLGYELEENDRTGPRSH